MPKFRHSKKVSNEFLFLLHGQYHLPLFVDLILPLRWYHNVFKGIPQSMLAVSTFSPASMDAIAPANALLLQFPLVFLLVFSNCPIWALSNESPTFNGLFQWYFPFILHSFSFLLGSGLRTHFLISISIVEWFDDFLFYVVIFLFWILFKHWINLLN